MLEDQLTGVGGWARQLQNRGGKRGTGSSAVSTRVDLPFVHFIEKRDYERGLSASMDAYCAGEVDVPRLLIRMTCFDRPFRTFFGQ